MNDTMTLLADLKLRFNVDHPDLEECYAYGYESAKAELAEEDNPYPVNSIEHEQWQEGWWAGFYGEQPLYQSESQPEAETNPETAANDGHFLHHTIMNHLLKIAGAIAASAIVGYQILEMVA